MARKRYKPEKIVSLLRQTTDVIHVLMDLFILRGIPAYIHSDNGPEFVVETIQQWMAAVSARTAFIEPGSPWENGYVENFNARLRDELLTGGSITPSGEPRFSSNPGGATTTRYAHMAASDTGRRLRKRSSGQAVRQAFASDLNA